MARLHLDRWSFALAGLSTLTAVAWWWVVFGQLIGASNLPLSAALPCLAADSDLCSLAQALCKTDHWLNVRRYDTELFRLGLLLWSAGIAMTLRQRWARIAGAVPATGAVRRTSAS